jgi:ubiquitin C-terminal hydrolase
MNSIFQVLLTIPELKKILAERAKQDEQSSLIYLFTSTFCSSELPQIISLRKLVIQCFDLFEGSKPYTKQDAQEFFYLFLNKIQSEFSEEEERKKLEELFQGKTTISSSCGNHINDIFYQLSLSVNQIESKYIKNRNNEEILVTSGFKRRFSLLCCKKQEPITINDCLRKYFENFSDYEISNCESCKKETCLNKIQLKVYPKYLFISLKRFEFNGKLKKITRKVFPLNIIELYDNKYELISIVEHCETFFKKHYRAYCKDEGIWMKCDDDTVTEVDEKHILNVEPYIMLYKQIPKELVQLNLYETVKIDHIKFDYEDPRVDLNIKDRGSKRDDFKRLDNPNPILENHSLSFQAENSLKLEPKDLECEKSHNSIQNHTKLNISSDSSEKSDAFNESPIKSLKTGSIQPMFPIPSSKKLFLNSSLTSRHTNRNFNSSEIIPFNNYQTTNEKLNISPLIVTPDNSSLFANKSEMPRISPFPQIQPIPQSPEFFSKSLSSSKKLELKVLNIKEIDFKTTPDPFNCRTSPRSSVDDKKYPKTSR